MLSEGLKILVADDHPLFRAGVIRTLTVLPGIEIIEANDGDAAGKIIEEAEIDIALIDLRMPGKTGLDILSEVSESGTRVKIILLTMYKNLTYFYHAVSLGVKGYLLKETAVEELIYAVKEVLAGRVFISPRLKEIINSEKKNKFEMELLIESISSLTKTEKEIIRLLSEWKTSNEIADILCNSVRTIENHRAKINEKLNIQGTHSLIKFAIENKELF